MKFQHLIRVFALFTLACATLSLAACGLTSEEKDAGPNVSLSNEELLRTAVANMETLNSFHLEIEKQVEGISGKSITDLEKIGFNGAPYHSISATIDLEKSKSVESGIKQMAIKYSGLGPDPSQNLNWNIIVTGGVWYDSTDGGRNWSISNSEGPGFLAVSLLNEWDWHGEQNSQIGRALNKGLAIRDGNPRIEKIDGVSTRHITVDMESIKDVDVPPFSLHETDEIHFWVSTDSHPTVRQILIEGGLPPPPTKPTPGRAKRGDEQQGISFTRTWKWSRFNEDFGWVKAPPIAPTTTVTVKSS